MTKLLSFLIAISLTLASCAFEDSASSFKGKKRYSRNFEGKFVNAGKGFARKIKPSESMQAGLPISKTPLNFMPSDYGYNTENYRNYKIKGSEINKFSSNGLRRNSEFKTVDDELDDELAEYSGEREINRDNLLESGVYSGHFKIGQPYTAFGVSYVPQDEEHPLRPRSPYGASKAAARQLVKVWRESYDLYAVQGWLFNHEGTRRGEEFVTRKITKAVARIKNAIDNDQAFALLELGNLDATRDWSDAEDFVDGIWRMLNQDRYREFSRSWSLEPNCNKQLCEYVLSSNETHSIREFVELAFAAAGIEGYWQGTGLDEMFLQKETGRVLMVINQKFYRPAEVEVLYGDSTKAREELGWNPKTDFKGLIDKMIKWDILEYGKA